MTGKGFSDIFDIDASILLNCSNQGTSDAFLTVDMGYRNLRC